MDANKKKNKKFHTEKTEAQRRGKKGRVIRRFFERIFNKEYREWLIDDYFVEIILLVGIRLDSRLRGKDWGDVIGVF